MLSQVNIYLKHSEVDAALTVHDLKGLVQAWGDRAKSVMNACIGSPLTSLPPLRTGMRGSRSFGPYSQTKGCTTLSFTLSAADNHWEDMHRLMPPRYENFAAGRRAAVIDSPHIADSYFGTRVDQFTNAFFDGVLSAKWKWVRHEYQGRGSIHTHGCVKARQRCRLN